MIGAQLAPNLEERRIESHWYALHTMSHCEAKVANYVRAVGVEVFLPDYVSRRQWNDRVKTIRCPLFPGYVFGRFQRKLPPAALSASGLAHVVGFADGPAAIPDEEIHAVRRMVESGLNVCGGPMLKIGKRIRMRRGPLKGLEGRLEQIRSQFRLVISVELLCRSVVAEVDPDAIEVL
jgi:transcriptional antiterminator NusG